VLACNGVELAAPILAVENPAADLGHPSLVSLAKVPQTAALVFSGQAVPVGAGPTVQLGAFSAWGAWPPMSPPLVAVKDHNGDGVASGVSYLAASRGGPPGTFALLYRNAAGTITSLASAMGIDGAAVFAPTMIGGSAVALGVRANGSVLAAVSAPSGDNFGLYLMAAIGGSASSGSKLGCASTPIVADAVRSKAGWILAAALGTPLVAGVSDLDCVSKFGTVGPPSKLVVTVVDPSGYSGVVSELSGAPRP
jgi:hypothetical protein